MTRTRGGRMVILALLSTGTTASAVTPTPGDPTVTTTLTPTSSPTASPSATPSARPSTSPPPTPGGSPTLSPSPAPTPTSSPTATATIPPMRVPGPGQVIFNEVYIDPPGSADRLEFVELRNLMGAPALLESCVLIEGAVDVTATCPALGDRPGNCQLIGGPTGTPIVVPPEGLIVFAYTGDLPTVCGVPIQLDYKNDLSFANTKPETWQLFCPDGDGVYVEIAGITTDWTHTPGKAAGLTWSLDPEWALTAPEDPGSWCVAEASDETNFCTTDDGASFGSPGQPNPLCARPTPTPTLPPTPTDRPTPTGGGTPYPPTPTPTPTATLPPPVAPPAIGEIIVSEIYIDPPDSEDRLEFVEIKNVSDVSWSLEGCYLNEGTPDITATCAPLGGITGNCDDLTGTEGAIVVAPGEQVVVGRTLDLNAVCGLPLAQDYSNSVSFANSKAETLSIYCPGAGEAPFDEVFRITYDWAATGGVKGQTWALDPLHEDNAENPAYWCPSAAEEANVFCQTDAGPSWGSPGAPNPACPEGPVVTPTPEPGTPRDVPLPAPGEVVFTELFIDSPDSSDALEYIELYNRSSEERSIEGCVFIAATDDETSTCAALGGALGNCDVVEGADGPVFLDPAGFTVLAKGAALTTECGVPAVQDYANEVSLANSKAETMSLWCQDAEGAFRQITSVRYDWDNRETGRPGQSWSLDWDNLDAAEDPASWCPTLETDAYLFCTNDDGPSWGTPGGINPDVCPVATPTPTPTLTPTATAPVAPGGWPEPGEIIFTELFIDPPGSGDRLEFMELKSLASEQVTLEGCVLIERGEETTATCGALDDAVGNCDVVEGDEASITVEPGAYVLLAQNADPQTLCSLPVVQDYNNAVGMANSAPESVSLYCPNGEGDRVVVAQMTYDWENSGGTAGETWLLSGDAEGDPTNPLKWCPATLAETPAGTFCETADGASKGTPGAANPICPEVTPPPPPMDPALIHLTFTEIMVGPDPSTTNNTEGVRANEWFEWVNQGETDVSLAACWLEVDKLENVGTPEADPDVFRFAEGDGPQTVVQGARQVWAKDGCLLAKKMDGQEELACEVNAPREGAEVLPYTGIDFSNSAPEYLALYCADSAGAAVLIDQITFDYVAMGEPRGRSWQLEPDQTSPTANDDADHWCNAPLVEWQVYAASSFGQNYGTPGSENSCDSEVTEPPEPRCAGCYCRLDTAATRPGSRGEATWSIFLAALGLVLIRRRPW